MNYYLGVDSGGTVIKAGLFNEKGAQIALYKENTQIINEKAGWVERDLEAYWQEACQVIKGVLAQSGISAQDIKGMSISAQGKGVYLLDKKGNPLRNGILSSDSRAIDIVKNWQYEQLPETVYPLTKQTLWTGHPVSILRWLKDNEPKNYQNIGAVLMSHDYLRYRLTDDISAEATNISESNLFNGTTGQYDPILLDLFGIKELLPALPKVKSPTECVGYVTKKAADACGLAAGTPVYAGLFDIVATALCSGIGVNDDKLNVVMGTWAVTSGITDTIRDEQENKYVYGYYAEQEQYIIHEASPTSASNYEWLAAYLGDSGTLDHAKNEAEVKLLQPAASSLFFLPFLYGSNAGLDLKSGLYGLQAHHKKSEIIQSVWEGILFCHNVHLQRMLKRFPNTKILRVTGGPTQSKTWMQMLANLTGLTVEIPQIEETGALGASMIAIAGENPNRSLTDIVKNITVSVKRIDANPDHYQAYQRKYQRYLQLVDLLKQFEVIS